MMESLGAKLREAREQHNYSLEQVARDTHISKHFLKALEDEEFSILPGETYVMGFLRNYAEYLSLNPEEVVNLYQNMKIQEQPLPMSELLEKRGKSRSFIYLLIILIVIVLGAGGYLLYRFVLSRSGPVEVVPTQVKTEEVEYNFQEEVLTRWFNAEDRIKVPVNGRTYTLQLLEVADKLILKIPGGTLELNIGQERLLDLNEDSKNDLRILLNDLDVTATESRANMGLYKITKGADRTAAVKESEQPVAEADAVRSAVAGGADILLADGVSPFRVSITFRGYCLFRYLLDDEGREERFFHKGENFSLDVKEEVKLWISNAGALRMMVAGRDVAIGKPGEVTAKIIRWSEKEESGSFALQVLTAE